MAYNLPLPPARGVHVQCFADPGLETDSIVVETIVRIRVAVAVHVEHVGRGTHGVGVPYNLVIQAHLVCRVVGKDVSISVGKKSQCQVQPYVYHLGREILQGMEAWSTHEIARTLQVC